ncbi:MAG: hypothetical protein E6848_21185 [Bradyrhizobium sp.]|nr:hypothetical protein [Bradyrhizobium sp.]
MSHDLVDLVRADLTALSGGLPWDVRLVDHLGDAGAEPELGTVRIHKNWRTSIHEPRLAHVTRHYPLAIEPFDVVDPREVLERHRMQWRQHRVMMCRAVTLEREWRGGRFTGNLIAGPAFIARVEENQPVAHWHPAQAVAAALTAARSKQQAESRHLAKLRRNARAFLDELVAAPRFLGLDLPVAPYRSLVPGLWRLRRTESIPFLTLKDTICDQIGRMDRDGILKLLLQLGLDLAEQRSLLEKLLDEFFAQLNDPTA